MTTEQAKELLAAYRHGTEDDEDPRFAEALALAHTDAELNAWLAQSLAFDASMRGELARVLAPAGLRQAILAEHKIIRPAPWWNPRLTGRQMAVAAAVVLAIGVGMVWFSQRPASFAEFRHEIADQSWGPAPHVEVPTASLQDVREFLAAQHLATNFTVPPALAQTKMRGCTLMHWRGHEVPVLCFTSDGQHLHLIVADRALFPDAPSQAPQTDQWQAWRTASWSQDDHSYVLTGLKTAAFLKKFRKDRRWDWGG